MKRSEFIFASALQTLTIPSALGETFASRPNIKTPTTMDTLFCSTCGIQFNDAKYTAGDCPICSDDRQYLPPNGQAWTKAVDLKKRHSNQITRVNDSLYQIITLPKFAIGQRAFLILTPSGNILWDCISLLDDTTVAFINSKGGLKAIAISHPHYYSSMNDWADEFDCPIYIHQNDEEYIYTKGERVSLWNGTEKELWDSIRIMNIGGHYPGSCILSVPSDSPEGTILCGDTFFISPSRRHVSVMYSYPNFIPVALSEIERINGIMKPIPFDTLRGAFDNQDITKNAKEVLHTSFDKYIS